MSPYHTTGEFATSLILLRSRQVMYTCFAEHMVLLSLSQICACPTNMSTRQICATISIVYDVNLPRDQTYSPFSRIPLIIHSNNLDFVSNQSKNIYKTHIAKF